MLFESIKMSLTFFPNRTGDKLNRLERELFYKVEPLSARSKTLKDPCHYCARTAHHITHSRCWNAVYEYGGTSGACDARMTTPKTAMHGPSITQSMVRATINKDIFTSLHIRSRWPAAGVREQRSANLATGEPIIHL